MNKYFELVDRLKVPSERLESLRVLSGESLRARDARGKKLAPEIIEALIWGLSHENPVVRRCCLEVLDAHPNRSAVAHIVKKLDDPVPRVRWHAVHALTCDACKAGDSFVSGDVLCRLRHVAESDPSPRVRGYARWVLEQTDARAV